jgi:8-oxo-dGTP diphosphatase
VLWRGGIEDGEPGLDRRVPLAVEVALVHRPRYDDWSLPKGKLRRREHPLVAACREVLEETGVRPAAGPRLPGISYPVRLNGRVVEKTVDYWAMTAVADSGFAAGTEVDDLRWLPVPQALARLSYAHEADVLDAFASLPPITGVVVLVRHAHAGTREAWAGPDAARPLDATGLRRAHDLADLLVWFAPERLESAAPYRCVQTLVPFAALVGRPIEIDSCFDEGADPALAAKRLCELGATNRSTVVCSQGGLIPAALGALTGEPLEAYTTQKGAGWVLTFTGSRPFQVDPLPRP